MKLSTAFAMGATLFGCTCVLAAPLPRIERSDLAACTREISTFHDKEIDYQARNAAEACDTQRQHFDKEYCARWQGWLKEDIAKEDFDWWMEGNGSCEGTDYPCWGPSTWNEGQDAEKILAVSKHYADQGAGKPPANDWSAEEGAVGLNHWSWAAFICVSEQWIDKHKAWKAAGNTDTPSPANEVVEDAKPSGSASEGGIHAAQCAEALAKQDAEFDAMTKNAPKPGQDTGLGGARALYQMGMYITDARLKVLDQFCKGEPQYAMYPGTKASFDSALTGCTQVSSDGGKSCAPLKLW